MKPKRIEGFYNRAAPIYKFIHYNFFFKQCFETAIEFADLDKSHKVLEVGVGTGLSFDYYPSFCQLTGIDLSENMLSYAQKSLDKKKLKHVKLLKMDASDLKFEDNQFDCVMAFMVLSATRDPVKILKEAKRVCKPGGKIIFGNHFLNPNKFIALGEKFFQPFFYALGFDLALDLNSLVSEVDLHIVESKNIHKFWTVVLSKNKQNS